ncbi:MAG TPA: GlsB/YeaQ/YmgE family stress response membrane protein [Blastocatellia bacterium]|nr:GlsB/YeaQ/YmgE family stress response membrane protein [Blastocatellia bacterium]
MSLYQIISWIVVGLIVGALARFLVPGKDPMGCIATILLGVAGSFVGGFISSLIWHQEKGSYFHPASFVMSLVGAIILVLIWRKLRPAA